MVVPSINTNGALKGLNKKLYRMYLKLLETEHLKVWTVLTRYICDT